MFGPMECYGAFRQWLIHTPLLGFPTPKLVKIFDWRLGLLLRMLQLAGLLYTIFTLFDGKKYLVPFSPQMVVTMWSEGVGKLSNSTQLPNGVWDPPLAESVTDYQKRQFEGAKAENNTTLCGSLPYEYQYDDQWTYKVSACSAQPSSRMAFKGAEKMSSYYLATTTASTATARMPAQTARNDQDCEELMKGQCPETSSILTTNYSYSDYSVGYIMDPEGNGTCECAVSETTFNAGAESVTLLIDHIASVFFPGGFSQYSTADMMTHMIRLNTDGSEVYLTDFDKGQHMRFTIAELMEWLEIDLDEPMNVGRNQKWLATPEVRELQGESGIKKKTFPTPRLTGLRIVMDIKYYNYNLAKARHKDIPRVKNSRQTVVAVVTFKPLFAWTSMGDNVASTGNRIQDRFMDGSINLYHYGIHLDAKVGGELLQFSWAAVISALIEGVVLFNLSNLIVRFIAQYLTGKETSTLYRQMIDEETSIPTAYARFVMQATAASVIFDMMDQDRSGKLSIDEMHAVLTSIFSDLPNDEAVCLSDCTMKVAKAEKETVTLATLDEDDREVTQEEKDNLNEAELAEAQAEAVELTRRDFVNVFTGPPCNMEGVHAFMKTRLKKKWAEKAKCRPHVRELMEKTEVNVKNYREGYTYTQSASITTQQPPSNADNALDDDAKKPQSKLPRLSLTSPTMSLGVSPGKTLGLLMNSMHESKNNTDVTQDEQIAMLQEALANQQQVIDTLLARVDGLESTSNANGLGTFALGMDAPNSSAM